MFWIGLFANVGAWGLLAVLALVRLSWGEWRQCGRRKLGRGGSHVTL